MPSAVPPSRRSLVVELLHNHRLMLQVLALLLSVALVTAGFLLTSALPRLERYIDLAYHARSAQVATLEQTVDLRGWLATGDASYLDTFEENGAAAGRSMDALVGLASGGEAASGVTDVVIETVVARGAWEKWADGLVAAPASGESGNAEQIRSELAVGRALLDDYRTVSQQMYEVFSTERDAALADSRVALLIGLSGFVVALVSAAALTMRRRRSVVAEVVGPIEHLLGTIGGLRDGDLTVTSPRSGVAELDQVGEALDELATSLREAQDRAVAREDRLTTLAARFETVVRVGREISGSLSVRYVSATVTRAAAELLGSATTLWVRGGDQAFHATSRSDDPHGDVPPLDLDLPEVVASAAADARLVVDDEQRAYPLVLAGMVVGVLQARPSGPVAKDTDQVLEALLSTAAAALESATLHSAARELADVDALTQLPNRRRFEGDMEAEWDRCRRYGRPMCLVMFDLDHFKTLNDEHGHLFGDEVLRGAAEALGGALRASDTAYRYGGEEFAVLLRETGLEDGQEVAERLRRAIGDMAVPRHGVLVTASAGVAERLSTMAHHTELVGRADAALYRAKHDGRDKVAVAAD